MTKIFISREQVQEMNEKHGWFEFADAQSDVSNAFANEAIERYERIREAAPELLRAAQVLEARISYYASLHEDEVPNIEQWAYTDESGDIAKLRAAIKKATGE